MVIPLSMEFIRRLTAAEQQELMVKSLHMSLYAIDIQHLEWYETAAFFNFLQIVAIVVLVFTGVDLLTIVVLLATSYALKKVLESNADGWLKVLAVVAYVTINFYIGGGFEGDFGLIEGAQLVSLTTGAGSMYTQAKMEDLQEDIAEYRQKYKTIQEEREAKEKELELKIDPTYVAALTRGGMYVSSKLSTSAYYNISKGSLLYNYNPLYEVSNAYNYNNKYQFSPLS